MNSKKLAPMIVGGVVALIILAIVTNSTFLTIKSGEKGVLFKKFSGGLDKENIYDQGFHIIAPWNDMIVYSVREIIREENMDVLSRDGLPIEVDVSVRFRPDPKKIGYLHDEIGPEYDKTIVRDVLRAAAREVMGKYTPEELYAGKRDSIRMSIEGIVGAALNTKYVKLEAVNIRSIQLPQRIKEAIEQKLVKEQERDQYEFKIQKEQLEAERKLIEAEGIKQFQEIVAQGLSQDYLRWKGIEATKELANSTNSKVVIVGSGKDGLPLILGNQ